MVGKSENTVCEMCKWFDIIKLKGCPRYSNRVGVCCNCDSEYIDEVRDGKLIACQDFEAV